MLPVIFTPTCTELRHSPFRQNDIKEVSNRYCRNKTKCIVFGLSCKKICLEKEYHWTSISRKKHGWVSCCFIDTKVEKCINSNLLCQKIMLVTICSRVADHCLRYFLGTFLTYIPSNYFCFMLASLSVTCKMLMILTNESMLQSGIHCVLSFSSVVV